jgi:hypothetical protein
MIRKRFEKGLAAGSEIWMILAPLAGRLLVVAKASAANERLGGSPEKTGDGLDES